MSKWKSWLDRLEAELERQHGRDQPRGVVIYPVEASVSDESWKKWLGEHSVDPGGGVTVYLPENGRDTDASPG